MNIAQGVLRAAPEDQGAGDQGMMFGFACNETPTLMPAPIFWAHQLSQQLTKVRKDGTVPFFRPDGKTQVSFEYMDGKPVRINNVVVSTQHAASASQADIIEAVKKHVIRPVLEPSGYFDEKDCEIFINTTGRFVVGGPMGDCGLTGRKIIQDTYGGSGHHGGGAFSGKDPSKVDRSGAYMGRVRTYESIVKGHNIPQPGVPESFKVLVKELQALCLDVQVLDRDGNQIELKEDEDAMDTFNLARMDAEDERHRSNPFADEAELEDAGFEYVADDEVNADFAGDDQED